MAVFNADSLDTEIRPIDEISDEISDPLHCMHDITVNWLQNSRGALNTRRRKNMRFSTEIAAYLGNGTIDLCCYGMLIKEVIGGGSIRVGSDDIE